MEWLPFAGGQPVVNLPGREPEPQDLAPLHEAVLIAEEPGQIGISTCHIV